MTLLAFDVVPIQDSNEPLVKLDSNIFVLQPAYFQQGLSNDARMYLRKGVVEKLEVIQRALLDCRIKIFDGFRPREVQRNIYRKFWNELKEQYPRITDAELKDRVGMFVTDPDQSTRIPPHSTGGTVDLTLTNASGDELPMGTAFDYFGPEAASQYYEKHAIDETIRKNRQILRDAMVTQDFRVDDDEWWHFDYGNQAWAYALHKPYAIYGEVKDIPPK